VTKKPYLAARLVVEVGEDKRIGFMYGLSSAAAHVSHFGYFSLDRLRFKACQKGITATGVVENQVLSGFLEK